MKPNILQLAEDLGVSIPEDLSDHRAAKRFHKALIKAVGLQLLSRPLGKAGRPKGSRDKKQRTLEKNPLPETVRQRRHRQKIADEAYDKLTAYLANPEFDYRKDKKAWNAEHDDAWSAAFDKRAKMRRPKKPASQ
jgi:hypothetical protein